ncbi:MAG: SpoVA/SpoVAEb family sporulation membrane protein [Clostridia bacterium]|nr:SpoVA/SpoVAEb family sporulation membrane protein [Clostridia bacterium]
MTGKNYERYARGRAKKSPLAKDCAKAFLAGGTICVCGEVLRRLFLSLGLSADDAGLSVSAVLIFVTAALTGLGVFDKIAKHAGGGTLVPITGFANAVASAAVDSKTEGFVTGVGAKIFSVAGPVILYAAAAATAYGLICWIAGLFG